MIRLLDVLSRLVTARPIATLIVLLAVTIALGAGFTRMAPQADTTVLLPEDSRVATASGKIQVLFGGTKDTVTATQVFRGNALTPDGLVQMDGVLDRAASDPSVAPIVMVLFWVLGTMTLLGIPYNVITARSIGIGVDYTIHVIHRYEEEFAHSRDPEAAARRTLGTTGSALTTALGFGVLFFSSLTPFQQFGLVTAITISYALIAAIIVVPPAMILWAAYQNYRLRSAADRYSQSQESN